MNKYQIIKQGVFERLSSFNERLNEECLGGWKAISISQNGNRTTVLLERTAR